MIEMHIIQAKFGDCFLLKYLDEDGKPSFMLIDGGPDGVYKESLKPALLELMKGSTFIRDVVVSHLDNDHITGVHDLLAELQKQKATGSPQFLNIGELWFNSFTKTIGSEKIINRLNSINNTVAMKGLRMGEMSAMLSGIDEGNSLVYRARNIGIPVNTEATNGFYLATNQNLPIRRGNMTITVAGPSSNNLEQLKLQWEKWLKENEDAIDAGKYTPDVAAALDRSVPNLSSIVMLVRCDGKSILFTGDCRSDHLQQGLIETGLTVDGKLHVNILKVPHHGSKRNSNRKFFEEVTADVYVISADGKYNNPDEETMVWIVETAKQVGRKITIICTNETSSTSSLIKKYNPASFGYEIRFMGKKNNYLTVD